MSFGFPSYHDLDLLGDNTSVQDDHPQFVFIEEGLDRLYSHFSRAYSDLTTCEETRKLSKIIIENVFPFVTMGAFGVFVWKNRGVVQSKEAVNFVKCAFENAMISGGP